uniref:Uncharacterized protein n=1 Tax=Cacopsylla melanoneura TaxID=428564 RepID=A0A8D9AN08_9HEMI
MRVIGIKCQFQITPPRRPLLLLTLTLILTKTLTPALTPLNLNNLSMLSNIIGSPNRNQSLNHTSSPRVVRHDLPSLYQRRQTTSRGMWTCMIMTKTSIAQKQAWNKMVTVSRRTIQMDLPMKISV